MTTSRPLEDSTHMAFVSMKLEAKRIAEEERLRKDTALAEVEEL